MPTYAGGGGGAPGQQSRLTRTGVLVPDSKQMIVGYINSYDDHVCVTDVAAATF